MGIRDKLSKGKANANEEVQAVLRHPDCGACRRLHRRPDTLQLTTCTATAAAAETACCTRARNHAE
eukprot:COSAG05_NODE_2481_length_3006_cov_849.928793_1_plen_66_part_00